jgi:hypothetical protein
MEQFTNMQKKFIQKLQDEENQELADNAVLIRTFKESCSRKGIIFTIEHFNRNVIL